MPKLKAIRETFIKAKPIGSIDLPDSEKIRIPAGESIEVDWILPDLHQHDRVELKTPINGRYTWFLYTDHWSKGAIAQALNAIVKPNDITIAGVPYFAQNDSNAFGYRQCFAHSVAMMLAKLKPNFIDRAKANGYSQPENYYLSKLAPYGDTTDNASHIACLREEFGIDAYFSQAISPADLQSVLMLDIPVPIGVAFRDSGHWKLVKGLKGRNYIVNDPNGVRSGSSNEYAVISSDIDRAGENDVCSPDVMDSIFWDTRTNSDRDCGWAILVTAVNGIPTGVRSGL